MYKRDKWQAPIQPLIKLVPFLIGMHVFVEHPFYVRSIHTFQKCNMNFFHLHPNYVVDFLFRHHKKSVDIQ